MGFGVLGLWEPLGIQHQDLPTLRTTKATEEMNRLEIAEIAIAAMMFNEVRTLAVEGMGPDEIAEMVEKMYPTISTVGYALVQYCEDKNKDDFREAISSVAVAAPKVDDYEDIPF